MLLPPPGFQAPTVITLEGKHPNSLARCNQFRISVPMLEHLEKHGPASKFYDVMSVEETILDPNAIFEGLNRGGLGSGLCYARVPSCRWMDATNTTSPPAGMVFLVFVNPQASELHIFDWEFHVADGFYKGFPAGWRRAFKRKVWP